MHIKLSINMFPETMQLSNTMSNFASNITLANFRDR